MQQKELAQQRVGLRFRRRQKLPVVAQSAADMVAGHGDVAVAVCPPLPMLLPRQLHLLLEMVR